MDYLFTVDSFMSGWGMAEDAINALIFKYETREELEALISNLDARSEFNGWRYVNKKENPELFEHYPEEGIVKSNGTRMYIQFKSKQDYKNFYKLNYFKK